MLNRYTHTNIERREGSPPPSSQKLRPYLYVSIHHQYSLCQIYCCCCCCAINQCLTTRYRMFYYDESLAEFVDIQVRPLSRPDVSSAICTPGGEVLN